MQAIILAAGMGKRLKDLTSDNTKCMVKVNGVTLIDRMLHQLERRHLSKIIIVVGYEGQKLIDYIATLDIKTPVVFVNNPIYDRTNNIYSLYLASEFLRREDTLLLESDLIFEDAVLDALIDDPRETLALVDKYESWMDGTCVKIGDDDSIEAFIPGKKFRFDEIKDYYKTVNIYKFSKHFSATRYVPFLEAYSSALGNNEYYEQVLRVIMMLDEPEIKVKRLNVGDEYHFWYEIDDIQDLDIASSMFTPDPDEKVEMIRKRFGGYWRYPRLLDFCYTVNAYFPPQKLIDEIKANTEQLLTRCPSGMNVISLLAAKNFGVPQSHIMVGNGTAELINPLMSRLRGKFGFIRPTFDEYPNRWSGESIDYVSSNGDFSYTVDDLIAFFDDKAIDNLLIVNPNNPSGNYIPRGELIRLINWTKTRGITLIVDESSVDFADENDTLIERKILDGNDHLFVMKSISKSHGVEGLRLGVLVSGNTAVIDELKSEVAIWNINSFAEFYLQIVEKYKKDYAASLKMLRQERDRFTRALESIGGLRVIPSKSNFVMVELRTRSAKELVKVLLIKHNIFVRELTAKTFGKNYLRLSLRSSDENDRLIAALRSELQ